MEQALVTETKMSMKMPRTLSYAPIKTTQEPKAKSKTKITEPMVIK